MSKTTGPPVRFQLQSPGDGVYKVTLVGKDPRQAANTHFSGANQIRTVDLPAGKYTALIEPVGSKQRLTQPVRLNEKRPLVKLHDAYIESSYSSGGQAARPSWKGSSKEKNILHSEGPDRGDRNFAIGISVDTQLGVKGGWKAAEWPRLSQSHANGQSLALLLRRPKDWRERPRWRLTIAVENDAIWRVPLPLFRSGLQLHFAPVDTPTGPDFSLCMAPRDPAKAALVASLDQLAPPNATEIVQTAVATSGSPFVHSEQSDNPAPLDTAVDTLSDKLEDPWAAAAAALLLARHNEVHAVSAGVRRLREKFPWLPDAAIVLAWAEAASPGSPAEVEAKCLALIKSARLVGATYFTAADTLALEMLCALELSASTPEKRAAASEERALWARRSKGRMPTGAFLSWEDERRLSPNGDLFAPEHAVLARGKLAGGSIITSEGKNIRVVRRGTRLEDPPALSRPITHDDDPIKGRFGGRSRRGPFSLSVHFGRALGDWVQINLKVENTNHLSDPAKLVEVFLHNTFDPDRVTLEFVNGVAEYSVLAWGGFTVGAWIADRAVELELDLALEKDAPRVIREL